MDEAKQKNLRQLCEQFFDREQARQAAEDIHSGDEILRRHAAGQPDEAVLAEIKARLGGAVADSRSIAFRRTTYKVAAVAAVLVIGVLLYRGLFETGGTEPEEPVRIATAGLLWDSDDISADDPAMATIKAEIEQLEGEMFALQSLEDSGNGDTTLTELEIELIEISSGDFWKG